MKARNDFVLHISKKGRKIYVRLRDYAYVNDTDDRLIKIGTTCKPAITYCGQVVTSEENTDLLKCTKAGYEYDPICIYPGGIRSISRVFNKQLRKKSSTKPKSKGIQRRR